MNAWLNTVAATTLVMAALTGCGSNGNGGTPPPTSSTQRGQVISAAALEPSNDTSTNSSASFAVLQQNGVTAVTVNSAPVINFTVFTDRTVKQGLVLSNVSFALAKLVPGTNGGIDRWESYVSRTETAAAGVGPNGTPALASARQATTDPKPAGMANQLVYNGDGFYTYTFSTDITDPTKTAGVTFEPGRTHRIAIQLSYLNAAGETVRVNPYFDFTFTCDANNTNCRSTPLADPVTQTRVMADVAACNGCHERLALHGGGRVDVQFCVMCHNPGTTDANSGNVLTMQTMVHKIHAGRLLKTRLDANEGGEHYEIWGFGNSAHDYAEVGFPQDLRNCTVCHTGANPKTPQGDNWKSRPSKESCLTCHANNAGSAFDDRHVIFAQSLVGAGAAAKDIANADCAGCHRVGTSLSPERVHWNQNEENAAKYRMNIESATYDAAARTVTIKYFLSDPTSNNAAYNLVTSDCTGSGATLACSNQTRFGNLRFYLAYQSLVGQSTAVTEFTSFNNGGSSANVFAYRGTNDGANKYTAAITLPADTATAVAAGTARVISIGQIKEPKLEVKSAVDPRPEVVPRTLVNVVVQHTYADVALSGTLNPRRQVVATEKCNVCHGALGTTSGSNTLAEAFHGGARNRVEACALCHDPLRSSSSTVMTNGAALQESYQFKRMIHGIHGNSRRDHPFTHGNPVAGPFNKDGALTAAGTILNDQRLTINNVSTVVLPAGTAVAAGETFVSIAALIDAAARGVGYTGAPVEAALNYAAEVAYPAVGLHCTACHVNDSYKNDRGTVGAVVSLRNADPMLNTVISPRAATCTACHDSARAIDHVTQAGKSSFGTRTMAQDPLVQEVCADCHAPGGFLSVDIVHGLK